MGYKDGSTSEVTPIFQGCISQMTQTHTYGTSRGTSFWKNRGRQRSAALTAVKAAILFVIIELTKTMQKPSAKGLVINSIAF